MIRKHLIRLSVLVLVFGGIFSFGHTAFAGNYGGGWTSIYQPYFNCAQINGLWDTWTGSCFPTQTDPVGLGCWVDSNMSDFSLDQSTGWLSYHSTNGENPYGLFQLSLGTGSAGCPAGTTGNVMYITFQDAAPVCQKTPPQYFTDNCTAQATINVNNSCSAGGTWSIDPGGYTGTSNTVSPAGNVGTTYTITYTPPTGYTGGNASPASQTVYPGDTDTFNVGAGCTPQHHVTVTLTPTSNPDQCSSGTTIGWTSVGATSCSASWTSSTATSGSQAVKPSTSPQTYSMTCTDGTETGSDSVDITSSDAVNGVCSGGGTPSVNLIATPSSINAGQSSTLSWSTSGGIAANSCSAYWTSQTGTSGSQTVSPLSTTPYSIVCHENDNNSTPVYGSAQVNVAPTSAVIFVYSNIAQGGGTVNPGGFQGGGTGLSSYTYVTPDPTNGTTYTITPNTVPGYTYDHTEDGQTGAVGTSALLFPGGSKFFQVVYANNTPAFTYTLQNSGPNSVSAGGSTQETITKTLTGGTASGVSLAVSGLPSGVTVSGISGQGTAPTSSATITLAVDSSVNPGSYPITVTGSPNNVTTQFNLNVNHSSNINVTCVPSPAVAKVGQSVTWTATASGGTGVYTDYAWSGTSIPTVPPVHGASNTYSVTYSTVGTKTTTATVTDSNNKTGSCQAGSAVVNISPTFQEF